MKNSTSPPQKKKKIYLGNVDGSGKGLTTLGHRLGGEACAKARCIDTKQLGNKRNVWGKASNSFVSKNNRSSKRHTISILDSRGVTNDV